MNKGKGILFVLSGPSGTGKGTVCEMLLSRDSQLHLSVSATTRECRENEIPDVTYHYVSKERFGEMIENDEVLEYAVYNGKYYGTPKSEVEKLLGDGKDVLLEIEPQGALTVKRCIPEAVLIFLIPPSFEELERRLITRGRESEAEIRSRLETSKWELEQADKYNKLIVNDDLDECVGEVIAYINEKREERAKIKRLISKEDSVL